MYVGEGADSDVRRFMTESVYQVFTESVSCTYVCNCTYT